MLTAGSPFTKPGKAQARQALVQVGQLPLRFETNRGQFDAGVRFAARGLDYGLALTPTAAVLTLRGAADRVAPDRHADDHDCADVARRRQRRSGDQRERSAAGPRPSLSWQRSGRVAHQCAALRARPIRRGLRRHRRRLLRQRSAAARIRLRARARPRSEDDPSAFRGNHGSLNRRVHRRPAAARERWRARAPARAGVVSADRR